MPSGTMLRFTGALAAMVLLIAGALWGVQWAREAWGNRETEEAEQVVEVNPYLHHQLDQNTAYVLANQYMEARSDEEARKVLLEVFRHIGVGVYTHDGQRVLAGSERGPNDLWMYDFHWKILAREGRRATGISFADYSHMIGQFLMELPDPQQLQPILFVALNTRYEEAQKNPSDPRNFNVLFMDGLARRHVRPYSFGDANDASISQAFLDPIQTYLLLLEFFARPPASRAASWLPAWDLVPKAHADGVCDLIKGDAQGNFGAGVDTISVFTEHVSGMVGKITQVIGNVTGVVGFAGDLLTLYGIDIRVLPQPYTIHLIHDEPYIAGIQATVTFDGEIASDQVLKCGWLAGKKMPVKGPLPGVILTWEFSPALPWPLVMNSEMLNFRVPHAGGFSTRTDAGGSSVYLIDPRPCPQKEGRRVGRDYMATVSARVVTADIPTPAGLGLGLILKFGPGMLEYFMGGRKGYARFRAEWHEKKPPERQY
jgi:hypothetical protein